MMKSKLIYIIFLPGLLVSCAAYDDSRTLASLRDVSIELKEAKVDGSLDKAMQSYQRFLQETPESALTPEAIRRLADLKLEKEYGVVEQPAVIVKDDDKPEKSTVTTLPKKTSQPKNTSNCNKQ